MMRINHRKLIAELLPVWLRRPCLTALIEVFSGGLANTFNRFRTFYDESRYKVSANASVISLEHHVCREFDVICRIEELDGEPYDFNVIVGGDVDESQLFALIDRYKAAGKSYRTKIDRQYSYEWTEYVCEKQNVGYLFEWTNYVCERQWRVIINVSFRVVYTSLHTRLVITLTASQPSTELHFFYVHYDVFGGWGSIESLPETIRGTGFILMDLGQTVAEIEVVFNQANTNFEVDNVTLNAWAGSSYPDYHFDFTYNNN
jgi:hypothetical protein